MKECRSKFPLVNLPLVANPDAEPRVSLIDIRNAKESTRSIRNASPNHQATTVNRCLTGIFDVQDMLSRWETCPELIFAEVLGCPHTLAGHVRRWESTERLPSRFYLQEPVDFQMRLENNGEKLGPAISATVGGSVFKSSLPDRIVWRPLPDCEPKGSKRPSPVLVPHHLLAEFGHAGYHTRHHERGPNEDGDAS